jgi:transcription termination/antitermination protein NusG
LLKLEDNPSMLPATVRTIGDLKGDWWVAHTKSRNEKALAHDLAGEGIGYYLPMRERVMMSGGRKRRLMYPLFTSYVFFCGGVDERYRVMVTGRVCQVIPVANRSQFVSELTDVERALASNCELEMHPFAVVGRRCRVRAGPWEGVSGTVIRRNNRARLVLWVSMLGQGASLEIDTDLLEPAD